jgi:hypothetical protein
MGCILEKDAPPPVFPIVTVPVWVIDTLPFTVPLTVPVAVTDFPLLALNLKQATS